MKDQYRPLPEGLTIKGSGIEGLGLFATKPFPKGHKFGITHVKDDRFSDGYIRTPLGGFYNHSESPNCESVVKDDYRYLVALEDIGPDTELTSKYKLYEVHG